MKANKKTLMAVKSFLLDEQGSWDIDEMKSYMASETKLLQDFATDECSVDWGETEVCNLSDFIDAYTDIFLQNICNVLDSFVGDDIDCYFEIED